VDRKSGCILFILDDTTGLVPCVWWDNASSYASSTASHAAERRAPLLGSTLHVHGRVIYEYYYYQRTSEP